MRKLTEEAVIKSFNCEGFEERMKALVVARDLLLEDISYHNMSVGELQDQLEGAKAIREFYDKSVLPLSKAKIRMEDKINYIESLIKVNSSNT